MITYYPRLIMDRFRDAVRDKRILLLRGPRQSGKTTLMKMLLSEVGGTYIDFTQETWAERFSRDPLSFSNLRQPLFLDEISYVRNAGRALKTLYDEHHTKMIVSGSGAFDVKQEITGHLVGRVSTLTLYPLNFDEFVWWKDPSLYEWYSGIKERIWGYLLRREDTFPELPEIPKLEEYYKEYTKFGGYPDIVLNTDKEDRLKDLIETQLEKDLFRLFDIRDKLKFRDLMKQLAYNIGNLLNIHNLNINYKTSWRYLSIMNAEYILELISPYHKNLSTELRKTPKLYFYDLGVANLLAEYRLGIGEINENFVFIQLHTRFGVEKLRYWRTLSGAEIDFVIVNKNEPALPIEVKTSKHRSRALWGFLERYDLERGVIISDHVDLRRRGSLEVIHLPIWWV